MPTPPDLALILESGDPEITRRIAASLARCARAGDLVALRGELGAGKTVFAKGFGAGLDVEATINSPSFVLMAEYSGRLPLFHLDLYRLADASDALDGGLLDDRQSEGVTVIEWAERLGGALPADHLAVEIEGTGDDLRILRIEAHGAAYRRYLEAAS